MSRRDDRPEVPSTFTLAVLLAVLTAIVIVLALKAVPAAERPTIQPPPTVVATP